MQRMPSSDLCLKGSTPRIRWLSTHNHPDTATALGEAPLEVLTQRYALGQITKEDVGHIKQDIA